LVALATEAGKRDHQGAREEEEEREEKTRKVEKGVGVVQK